MIKEISLFGITDVGRARTHNEDDFAICKDLSKKEWGFKRDEVLSLAEKGALLVVADGMGGTNAGEVASHIAQETVKEDFNELDAVPAASSDREDLLAKSIIKAHQAVINHQHANLDTAGMGSTLVIAWVVEDSVHVAWSGDSRCYIYNGQSPLYPFTEDHSLVWQMVDDNQMTPEEARVHPESNIVIQSLGDEKNPPQPSVKSAKLYEGNRLILCSDGLNGMLSDEQIQVMLKRDAPLHETCEMLVRAANEAGGEDNITCLMLEVCKGPTASASDLRSQQDERSKPSTTRVLRTKNSYKNIIIAVLAVAISALAFWVISGDTTVSEVPDVTPADTLKNVLSPGSGDEENPVDSGVKPDDENEPEDSPPGDTIEDTETGTAENSNDDEGPGFPINETPVERPTPAEKDSLRGGLNPGDSEPLLNDPRGKLIAPKDTLQGSEIHPDSSETPVKPPAKLKNPDIDNPAQTDSLN
jgi:protein phosphatase